MQIDPSDLSLRYDNRTVAIVYFRAGYSPDDYPTSMEWEARRTIELSTAIVKKNNLLNLFFFSEMSMDRSPIGEHEENSTGFD